MALTSVIDPAIKTPGVYLDVQLGVGARSGGGPRKVLIYGNKTSSGTATVGEVVAVTSPDDSRTLFGARSELHQMVKAAFAANPSVTLYAIPVAESAGANATGTITVTGTATSAGTIEVHIAGRLVRVAYATGDDPTAVATKIADAISDQSEWPVTAANVAGVVTATAAQKGPRGDYISLRAKVTEGAGVSVATSAAYLSGGTTMDDPTTALDAVDPVRYHYHVGPYQTATELALFKAHVNAAAAPEVGLRQAFVFGSIDALAGTTTVATGLNAGRGQCAWHYNGDDTPGELAASLGAYRSRMESIDPAYNFDGDVLSGLRPQATIADRPTDTELASALNNGITPMGVTAAGDVFIVRSITTRSQDASANPDYAVLDTSKVTAVDAFADDLADNFSGVFANFKAADDVEGEIPDPGVLTPLMLKDWIYGRQKLFEDRSIFVNVDANLPNLIVELAETPAGRFNASIPCDVIEGAHQFAAAVRQVG